MIGHFWARRDTISTHLITHWQGLVDDDRIMQINTVRDVPISHSPGSGDFPRRRHITINVKDSLVQSANIIINCDYSTIVVHWV